MSRRPCSIVNQVLTLVIDSYDYELKLPKRKKEVSLFVDQETETNLKTEGADRRGNDVFLARLSLDRLGLLDRTFFVLGLLSTLYVSAPWNDDASITPPR